MSDTLELHLAWVQHVGDTPVAERWFETVIARHREPHRHYHTVRHVRWVVRHVLELNDEQVVDDRDAVVAAGFFHDAVYDPTASDNEAASARLATRALDEIGWAGGRTERVATMIAATATHESADTGEAVLIAADLAVLAADPGPYGDYVRAVRREYRHVDDDAWRTGRAAVLASFVERDAIFAPELRLDTWERRARANLAAELATLRD